MSMYLFLLSDASDHLWLLLFIIVISLGTIATVFFLITKRYIIRQKILKRIVERKVAEISRNNAELEKINIIKTRLISIISHDIITPLRFLHIAGKNILQNSDTMSEELKEEALTEIVNTSRELEMLSTNILNWIKYQNENRTLIKEEFNLHSSIEQIFSILRGLAKHKNIALKNAVPKSFRVFHFIEPLKIVIYNLVLNAINFMEKGNITIESRYIKLGLIIEVKDEGLGMTQEQIDNILADQFIVSSANVDGRKGNGLGFLIIKDLLKLTSGHFTIKSARNKGTSIRLFFPDLKEIPVTAENKKAPLGA